MALVVHRIPAFTDNYFWLFHQQDEAQAYIVDPGDAAPVLQALGELGLELAGIVVTHQHLDHIGGIAQLLETYPVPVYGPADIAQVNQPVTDGEQLQLAGTRFQVLAVPGHTLNHLAFFSDQDREPSLFCGDTLFAAGCGRLFEGSAEQMWQSLSRLASLPANTQVYCAHEYTLSNLRFAVIVEPDNQLLQQRYAQVQQQRANQIATVPFPLSLELATNPFLRASCPSVSKSAADYCGHAINSHCDVFATVRQWKDSI